MLAANPVELGLHLPSGRLHAQRFGAATAPLVLCLPGLTANMKSFDFLGERLGSDNLQVVALDLRGRGKSDLTPPGSYGMESHARDVFAAADALSFDRFSLIGHSMGAAVALTAVRLGDRRRIERVVLIDLWPARAVHDAADLSRRFPPGLGLHVGRGLPGDGQADRHGVTLERLL